MHSSLITVEKLCPALQIKVKIILQGKTAEDLTNALLFHPL